MKGFKSGAVSREYHEAVVEKKDAEIARLVAELAQLEASCEMFGNLLKRSHFAAGGTQSGPGSSWHDLPERILKLKEEQEHTSDTIRKNADIAFRKVFGL